MRTKADFPYYAGEPCEVTGAGWLLIMASVILAFLQLILLPLPTPPLNFIPAIIFTGLPFVALMAVTGWRAPAVFGPFGWRTLGLGLGFGIATLVTSTIAGILVARLYGANANPAAVALQDFGMVDMLLFLARTFIQLIGEELVSILPLLAVLWLCVRKLGMSRRAGIVVGVCVSTLWFSAMHLPTYGWNLAQCLGVIGTARLVMTIAYLVTRNIWVSAIAHVFNDWTLFLGSYGIGHLPIGVEA